MYNKSTTFNIYYITMADKKSSQYSAEDIQVLEGLDPVRKRPGMYIGSTGEQGLHHLIWEVFDNSLDEAMAGYATTIALTLSEDGSVNITDDGRGIPVETHKQTKKSTLETVLTVLHAGGKFGGSGYKISGGLHDVGVSVVNALSTHLRAEVCRDGVQWAQEYKKGAPTGKLQKVGDCPKEVTGTSISFTPDKSIFKEGEFRWKTIVNHLRQQAYLTKGFHIKIYDERTEQQKSYQFYFEGGVSSFVGYLTTGMNAKHPTRFYVSEEKDGMLVDVAFQYTDDMQSTELAFANNVHNPGRWNACYGVSFRFNAGVERLRKKERIFKGQRNFYGRRCARGVKRNYFCETSRTAI